jgi:uncharacterized protein YbjT (DUF2867 family)
MRVALTGASGLIGSALEPRLEADGHEVVRLVRRPTKRTRSSVTPGTLAPTRSTGWTRSSIWRGNIGRR